MTGQTISHYRILSRIGEGGMGVVYVAEDLRLGRRVAIKFPLAGTEEKNYRARFLREARAVSSLTHPNIAAVYDYGETPEGQPYIVMELAAGQTLGDILLGLGLSLSRAVEIIEDVAEALGEAHRRGIIHRDIKPSNVLINERGEVKVLDFGLAKQLDEERDSTAALSMQTRSDVVIGTPLYLSPEQARGAPVDRRSDLFALGALLYECIAGRPAFSGANVIEIGAQVLHINPPPPSQFNSRVPPELDRITLKALAKKPEDRYQSASEMRADLEAARIKLSDADTARTRRLATQHAAGTRTSALLKLSDTLRRPHLSPLTFIGALAVVVLCVWAVTYWRTPKPHRPLGAALALYERGLDAMREGAYYKAGIALEEAVKLDDKFALAHAHLAEAWAEQDYLERAMAELLVVSTLVPDNKALSPTDALYRAAVTATVGRRYAEAVRIYEEIARRDPDSPHVHLDLGRAYHKNDKIEAAIASYTEAARRDPGNATAYLRLGVLYGRRKQQAAASAVFDRAEKIYDAAGNGEGRAEVYYQRGLLFVGLGRQADARQQLQQALDQARAANSRYQQVQALLQLSAVRSSEGDYKQAQAYAHQAIELAQMSNMSNLTALGSDILGSSYYQEGNYDEAQKYFLRARELALNYKVRRIEAQALFNLGSMRLKQNRTDDGMELIKQASTYYEQGGYRKEAASCAMLLARTKRQKGDYAGALQTFEEQLRLAEQAGDMFQRGYLHRECGAVLSFQERYVEALEHFKQSHTIFKSLGGNQLLISYTLLNAANVLARLGRYAEARDHIKEALAIVSRPEGGNSELVARLSMMEAAIDLSEGHFSQAIAKSRTVLTLGAQYDDALVEANYVLGLARAYSGEADKGESLCRLALEKASALGDPWLISTARLALAEALIESDDARAALDNALSAHEDFARSGRMESAWRAMVIAQRASCRMGNQEKERECLSRTVDLLAQLERTWGPEALETYMSRPDVRQLRRSLETHVSPVPH